MINVLEVIRAPGDDGRREQRGDKFTVPYLVKIARGEGDRGPAAQAIFESSHFQGKWTSVNGHQRALAVGRAATLRAPVLSSGGQAEEVYDVKIEYQTVDWFPEGVYDVRGRGSRVEDVQWTDLTGNAICNKAGDFYQPLPPQYRYNDVLTIACRHAPRTWTPKVYGPLLGCINRDPWQIWAARRVLFRDQVYQRRPLLDKLPWWAEQEPDYYYYDVQYEFEIDPQGWNPTRMLNVGPRVKQGTKILQAKDGNNVRHGGKILLDNDGAALDVSKPAAVKPTWTEHWLKHEVPFSALKFAQRPLF